MSDRELSRRAEELAGFLHENDVNDVQLNLPPELNTIYRAPTRIYLFAIWDSDGKVIAASHPEITELVGDWPPAGADPDFFYLENFGPHRAEYYGLIDEVRAETNTISIMVAQARDVTDLINAIVDDFISDISWSLPLAIIATILICVSTIHTATKALLDVSQVANQIGPDSLGLRLDTDKVPREIAPLVAAMNNALSRVDKGFEERRRFTADAAHELRTPLAILRARIEQDNGLLDRQALRDDLKRMTRVVEQLLHLARAEAMSFSSTVPVDLAAAAGRVVGDIAPLALAQDRTVSLDRPNEATYVIGNVDIIETAIRNLIENALRFAPKGTDVGVRVFPTGAIRVRDFGPGVAASDQQKIFEPFWSKCARGADGAGLGLAIVAETARRFGGRIEVQNAAGGGASFTLSLPLHERSIETAGTALNP